MLGGFMALLLTTSLHAIVPFMGSLPPHAYPNALKIRIALPLLSISHRNLNLFPFRRVAIVGVLRICSLWAEAHCPDTRVLCGVQDSHLDMLLLIPGSS